MKINNKYIIFNNKYYKIYNLNNILIKKVKKMNLVYILNKLLIYIKKIIKYKFVNINKIILKIYFKKEQLNYL